VALMHTSRAVRTTLDIDDDIFAAAGGVEVLGAL
jgi:hypothetical protein